MSEQKVIVEVSARHIHLSAEHLAVLFGSTTKLTSYKVISQPSQFAADQKVDVVTSKGKLSVRVVGPVRSETQVELAASDCLKLGLPVVLRVSGTLEGTPGVRLEGPQGVVELAQGVIVAQRHLHISPIDAALWNLKHGDVISMRTTGTRPVTFHNVYVRSREGMDDFSFMIDTDEANSAGLKGGEVAELVR